MPKLIPLKTFRDERGSLSVIEREVGFPIRRVFYIYDVTKVRGGHRHKRTLSALVAVHGTVVVSGQSETEDFSFTLNSPSQCLLLAAEDWHDMHFEKDAVLLALASTEYMADDYIFEKYRP